MEDEINIRDYISVVLKRWYLVVIITLVSTLFVGLSSLQKKPVYEAKAVLLLKESDNNLIKNQFTGMFRVSSSSQVSFPSIIKSRAVAEIVLDNLKLRERIKGWNDPAVQKQELISFVQGMPRFTQGDLFEIKIANDDPALAADVANAFADAGEKFWRKMNYTEARKKREYIESQLPRVEWGLKQTEKRLKSFAILSPNPLSSTGIEFMKLKREYDIMDGTYTMLRKELETVKLDESKELGTFTLIDRAEKPLRPATVKVLLNFAIGLVLGGFSSVFLAFFLEYWSKTSKA